MDKNKFRFIQHPHRSKAPPPGELSAKLTERG